MNTKEIVVEALSSNKIFVEHEGELFLIASHLRIRNGDEDGKVVVEYCDDDQVLLVSRVLESRPMTLGDVLDISGINIIVRMNFTSL